MGVISADFRIEEAQANANVHGTRPSDPLPRGLFPRGVTRASSWPRFRHIGLDKVSWGVTGILGFGDNAQLPGEGNHEIGSLDPFAQVPLHPSGGGLATALRTSFVIAAVADKPKLPTLLAAEEPTTQSRAATVLHCGNSPPLVGAERRIGL
jgi:hypothetical protein